MSKQNQLSRRSALVSGLEIASACVASGALVGCGGSGLVEAVADGENDPGPGQAAKAMAVNSSNFETYVTPGSGINIGMVSGPPYIYVPDKNMDSIQAFAGINSRGILDSQASVRVATPLSIQFGRANGISYWQANARDLSDTSGISPATEVVIEADGSQNVGDLNGVKRVRWERETKRLTLIQLATDGLVTNNPRTQLNGQPIPTDRWLRFYCHFELGNANIPWPAHVAGKSTILIFQIKGDNSSFPPLTLEVRDNTYAGDPPSGAPDSRLFDVVLLRRKVNDSVNEVIFRVNGLTRRRVHKLVIDFFPAFTGKGHISLWFNGERVPHVDLPDEPNALWVEAPSLYPNLNDVYHPMWGIYRMNYTEKAPDGAAIVWHRAEVQSRQASVGSIPLQPDFS